MNHVPFQCPQLPSAAAIEQYFETSRSAHWFSNWGPCHELFRSRLSEFVGGEAGCVPVSSGTIGLMVALRACVGSDSPGREVLVPSFTFVASVSAILWSGLKPVFVDVAPEHWHLNPAELDAALHSRGSRVAAVIACSTFGTAPPSEVREAWRVACLDAGVPLIVDSAPGFGSLDEDGLPLGLQGDAEVFSFHATKPLAIGEGGAVFSRDPELLKRIAVQCEFGLKNRVLVDTPGLNGKMSESHAAIGLAALDRLPEALDARRARSERLSAGLDGYGYSSQTHSARSAMQFVPLLAANGSVRKEVLTCAIEAGVELRTYHPPLHEMSPLAAYPTEGELPVTCDLSERILSLPMAIGLSDDAIERIRAVLHRAAERVSS